MPASPPASRSAPFRRAAGPPAAASPPRVTRRPIPAVSVESQVDRAVTTSRARPAAHVGRYRPLSATAPLPALTTSRAKPAAAATDKQSLHCAASRSRARSCPRSHPPSPHQPSSVRSFACRLSHSRAPSRRCPIRPTLAAVSRSLRSQPPAASGLPHPEHKRLKLAGANPNAEPANAGRRNTSHHHSQPGPNTYTRNRRGGSHWKGPGR